MVYTIYARTGKAAARDKIDPNSQRLPFYIEFDVLNKPRSAQTQRGFKVLVLHPLSPNKMGGKHGRAAS